MFGIPSVYIWLALAIIFAVVEVVTTDIVSIWFAIGAVAGLIVSWLAPDTAWLQFGVFFAVSAVTMYFTRPVLTEKLLKKTPTNADMLIGKTAQVTQEISADRAGRVVVEKQSWMAKSDCTLTVGEMCTVVKIEGASLVVEKLKVNA